MRGTKLEAWRLPPVWNDLEAKTLRAPEGSIVPQNQSKMMRAARDVLDSIAEDVRLGLLETVGVESALSLDDGRCAMILELPEGADAEYLARAIDAENVEAWTDANGKVRVGISPWYSTKDVDQTVLCTIKVIHVVLGIHAADAAAQPKTLKEKLFASIAEIMRLEQGAGKSEEK